MTSYHDFHRRSIDDPAGFWAEQAQRIHWHKPFDKALVQTRHGIGYRIADPDAG